ncbi:MAG TPA: quinone-dependent dihydroorotate dehydrogenase, partial [Vicinamibacterales bacterium]|nr:quinone-dependent dihydroorotate dehydrogenase [Vicinamibacterales bacterium]
MFALPTEQAHALALAALQRAHSVGLIRDRVADPLKAATLLGLKFPNRVGLAAGFDKNARYIDALG